MQSCCSGSGRSIRIPYIYRIFISHRNLIIAAVLKCFFSIWVVLSLFLFSPARARTLHKKKWMLSFWNVSSKGKTIIEKEFLIKYIRCCSCCLPKRDKNAQQFVCGSRDIVIETERKNEREKNTSNNKETEMIERHSLVEDSKIRTQRGKDIFQSKREEIER